MLLLIGHTESTAIEPAFHDQPRKGKDALFAALKTKNGLRRSGCRVDWGVQETTHHGIFNGLIANQAKPWRANGEAVRLRARWKGQGGDLALLLPTSVHIHLHTRLSSAVGGAVK